MNILAHVKKWHKCSVWFLWLCYLIQGIYLFIVLNKNKSLKMIAVQCSFSLYIASYVFAVWFDRFFSCVSFYSSTHTHNKMIQLIKNWVIYSFLFLHKSICLLLDSVTCLLKYINRILSQATFSKASISQKQLFTLSLSRSAYYLICSVVIFILQKKISTS